MGSSLTEAHLGELKQIFELFDGDADGLLDVAEVGAILQLVGDTALTEAANGSPLLMSPDRTGGKHPVAAAAAESGKTADAWLERRPSSEAERSSTPTSRRRGA